LSKAGFDVQTNVDSSKLELNKILKNFSKQSETSDVSMIYTTGHGVEVNGEIYLIPSDKLFVYKQAKLLKEAINLKRFGSSVKSKKINLVFYGGCRNNPFDN